MSRGASMAGRRRGVAIAAVSLVFAAPLVLMVLGSLQRPGLPPPDGFALWPEQPRWRNYGDVTHLVPIGRQLLNSLIIVSVAVPVTVLVASLAGFAIVSAGHRGRRSLVVLSVLALLVPMSALWVPRVTLLQVIGLTDRTVVVAFPALIGTSPFLVLLFALAYSRIPRELYEAAQVEGLTPLRIWLTVALPLARPAAFAVGVLAFVFHWSNTIEPTLLLAREESWPVALGITSLSTLEPTLYPLFLAGAVLATIPAVFAFLLAQNALFEASVGV